MDHPTLVYEGLGGFLEVMVPYVTDGLRGDERVFVAARGDYLPALREALGPAGSNGILADTFAWHPHPARRLRAFHDLIAEETRRGARRFRLAGEPVWPAGRPEMVREWQRYESALNAVLAPHPVSLMCLYDSALPPAILDTARRIHPAQIGAAGPRASETFQPPEEFLRHWVHELSFPPPHAVRMPGFEDLSGAREFLTEHALRAGVGAERTADLVLAASEILTNAVVHARSLPELWAWDEGSRFACQITDRGEGIHDPLASYRPPASGETGYGLWLARQLVDLLQIDSGSEGTTIRLTVPIEHT